MKENDSEVATKVVTTAAFIKGNLLDFLELRQVLSTYDGDLRDLLWWPQERRYVMEILELQQGCEGPFGSSRD